MLSRAAQALVAEALTQLRKAIRSALYTEATLATSQRQVLFLILVPNFVKQ